MAASTICPQCTGGTAFLFAAGDSNRRLSTEKFHYFECKQCHLIFQPKPPAQLATYYSEDYHSTLSVQNVRRAAVFEKDKIDIVRRNRPTGRLLEIGASRGVFALLASEAGYSVEVIEMDDRCCAFINDALHIPAVSSEDPVNILRSRPPYDVIALWHVVEHMRDPWSLLDGAAENLAAGGVLVIATPNPDSRLFGWLGATWPHVDAPRHTCLIPLSALTARLHAKGLALVETITNDRSARSATRFGCGAWLARNITNPRLHRAIYLIGAAIGMCMLLLERGPRAGAYTAVFRKRA